MEDHDKLINKAILLVLLCSADMKELHGEILEVETRGHRLKAVSESLQSR